MKKPLELAYDLSVKFLHPWSLDATYKIIGIEVLKLVEGDVVSIYMPEGGRLKRVYTNSRKLTNVQPRRRGFAYEAYRKQKTIILTSADFERVHPEMTDTNAKYELLVPLLNRGRSFGVISVISTNKKFKKKEIESLGYLLPVASLAIRKAQLYNELHDAVKTRDLFVSMAAHELRTPVATMYIYLQLLKRKSKNGKKFNSEWVDNLLFEMSRLTKLIDELLQISQIRAGTFNYDFEEIDIVDVTKKSLSSFKATHKETKVITKNQTKAKRILLVGDSNKLIQVIINLLDNSAKHNVDNKPINLTLSKSSNHISLSIKDQGAGISKEDMEHLFDEFYKGQGHTKAGMGLGLYLVKRIIDKHNGKIVVISKPREGTEVKILLPKIVYNKD